VGRLRCFGLWEARKAERQICRHVTYHELPPVPGSPDVVPSGVGAQETECAGELCILLVERLTSSLRQAIPSELEVIPVEIQETGWIEAR